MAFDLDNEELRATRKLHGQDDGLYEGEINKAANEISINVGIDFSEAKAAIVQFRMNNKTSDKNVGSIEDIRDLLLFFKSHGWIPDIRRTINITNVILAIDNVLQEREQDKKRIQELEKELEKANRQLDLDYVDDNYITKEKVKELEEESKKVLDLIFEYGQIDGGHHKMWVIDQIVRILTKDKYNEWIKNYVYDEETGDTYSWDKGIAP